MKYNKQNLTNEVRTFVRDDFVFFGDTQTEKRMLASHV